MLDVQKDIVQNGVMKIDSLAVMGLRDANGQVSSEQLNQHIDRSLQHCRGINSSGFWNSFRAMEDLLAAQEERRAAILAGIGREN